jgi:hypothetical protein
MIAIARNIVSLITKSVVIQLPRKDNCSIWIKNTNQWVKSGKERVTYERDMQERLVYIMLQMSINVCPSYVAYLLHIYIRRIRNFYVNLTVLLSL